MPVCSKDARQDDKLTEAEEAGFRQLEDHFNVNARPDERGGSSHTEERHCRSTTPQHIEATKEYLKRRIQDEDVRAATTFHNREALSFARHKYLATLGHKMAIRAGSNPRAPHDWDEVLDLKEAVGLGIDRNGLEAQGITMVRFVFDWDPTTARWFEVTGYPVHPSTIQSTKHI